MSTDELQRLDCRRLQPVIQALAQGVRSYWDRRGVRFGGEAARVWGLHGALGQGKSTVVRQALEALDDGHIDAPQARSQAHSRMRMLVLRHGLRRRLDVRWIEASRLQSEHLNATLISRLVLPRLLGYALPMMLIPLAALGMAIWSIMTMLGWTPLVRESWTWFVATVSGLGIAGSVLSWLGNQHAAGYLEHLAYRVARMTDVAPDLVVLDDLDRATVDQQRAVLRALVRHTELLDCPLIVCFDETDLLASDPIPEDPAELLRKLIQVPLRLPPRSREDAVLLAWGAPAVWHRLNDEPRQTWGACLLDPIFVGHLARLMLITESVGPRRAKVLLAEVVAAAETLFPAQAGVPLALDDACGLLLLAALYQIHPALRRDPELLLGCLESGGDEHGWHAWQAQGRAAELFKWLQSRPREDALLRGLLLQADTMIPLVSGWRSLVLGRRDLALRQSDAPPDVTLADVDALLRHAPAHGPDAYQWWMQVGHAMDALASSSCGTESLDLARSAWSAGTPLTHPQAQHSGPAPDAWSDAAVLRWMWPMLVTSLCPWSDEQRERSYGAIARWLAPSGSAVAATQTAARLRAAWQREWANDAAVRPHARDAHWFVSLDEQRAEPALGLLKALRRGTVSKELSHRTWLAALQLPAHAHRPSVVTALAVGQTAPDVTLDEALRARIGQHSLLELWPALRTMGLQRSQITVLVQQHMQGLRDWLTAGTGAADATSDLVRRALGAQQRPWALLAWMQSNEAAGMSLVQWLEMLAPLCRPSKRDSSWSFEHWRFFLAHTPDVFRRAPKSLSAELQALDDAARCTALCLLAQGWSDATGPRERRRLWSAVTQTAPTAISSELATAALWLWADTCGRPSLPSITAGVPFGALSLGFPQAKALLGYVLDTVKSKPIADEKQGGLFRTDLERCVRYWATTTSIRGLDFYTWARARTKPWLEDSAPSPYN